MNNNLVNIKTNRPLSPHLSIYKIQISSSLSILHRISGFILFLGMIILPWILVGFVFYPQIASCECWNSIIIKIILFGWSMTLFYHYLNGIRHLFWDVGKGFEISTMNRSGIMVIIGTILLTISCWLLAYTY
jgi:succinate dehydrogenase / fumarate reductase cytochrome b subunit